MSNLFTQPRLTPSAHPPKISPSVSDPPETFTEKVLNIDELVTDILRCLPLPDLLIRVQRVSKRFQALINSDAYQQHRLFLKYNPDMHKDKTQILINPLFYPSPTAYTLFESNTTSSSIAERHEWKASPAHEISPPVPAEKQKPLKREAIYNRPKNWMNMLVVMPPVKRLYVIDSKSPTQDISVTGEGVTMSRVGVMVFDRVWASFVVKEKDGELVGELTAV